MTRLQKQGLIVPSMLLCALQTWAATGNSGPVASVSPTSITFPKQALGTTKQELVNILSSGTSALHISSISIDNPVFALSFSSYCDIGNMTGTPPDFTCETYIGFAPTVAGSWTATLTIVDDAPDSPQTVAVTATATGIELQPTRLKFHLVAPGQVTAAKPVSVTNTGSVPITISSIATTGTSAAEYLIQSNTCPQVLLPAAACSVGVAFAPTVIGKAEAALTITDNDAESPQKAILSGDGTDVLLTPEIVNFGKYGVVHSSPPVSITITNTSSADITITSIAINNFHGEDQFNISGNNCPAVLTAGTNCVVQVEFEPEQDGPMLGQLVVTDSEAGSPQTAQLTGTGEF